MKSSDIGSYETDQFNYNWLCSAFPNVSKVSVSFVTEIYNLFKVSKCMVDEVYVLNKGSGVWRFLNLISIRSLMLLSR